MILPQERRTARTPEQRKQDAPNRLEHYTDARVARHEENTLEGSELMRGGRWVVHRSS